MMNPPDQTSPLYQTTDLNLASYLRCRSFNIEDIARKNGKAVFSFRDSDGIRTAILEYANDGMIQARSFCNTLRDLKSLVR